MAWTAIPGVAKFRAAVLSALVTEIRPVSATKTNDETIISNATLQNDDELFVALAASTIYDFRLDLFYNSGATPDLKIGWTFPTGTTMRYALHGYFGAVVQSFYLIQTDMGILDGTAGNFAATAEGTVITSTTAGTLQFQWSQNTLTASNSTVLTGSSLVLRRKA